MVANEEFPVVACRLSKRGDSDASMLEPLRRKVPLIMAAPIACQLNVFSAEESQRYQTVRKQIEAAVIRIVEIDDGYVLHLPDDDAMLAVVADWVALERRCCPFFEFNVSVGGSDSSIRVALTGSPEVKQFLELELGSHVLSPSTLLNRGAS